MNTLDRTTYTALASVLLIVLCGVVLLMASAMWIGYKEDARYETSALRSGGRISGYTYWDEGSGKNADRRAGYYANVTFSTPEGPVTIRSQKRYDTPEHRNAMLGWEVDVLYFPGEASRARVLQWSEPVWKKFLPLLLLGVFGCLGILWMMSKWWRTAKP